MSKERNPFNHMIRMSDFVYVDFVNADVNLVFEVIFGQNLIRINVLLEELFVR